MSHDSLPAAQGSLPPWPPVVFDAAVLRGLDGRARRELTEAGNLRTLKTDEVLYRTGDSGDTFYVVASGRIGLRAVRRGDDGETLLRTAESGGVFGEEATVGTARRATAIALEKSIVAEIPVHIFRRVATRSGKAEFADKLERALRRSATRDLLSTLAFTRDLDPDDIDLLLDAVAYRRFDRGQPIYREGDPASELWLIADGMVQIQTEDGDRVHVRAFLNRGDFFGDIEITERRTRTASAVASGSVTLLSIPARAFTSLVRKTPELIDNLRRIAIDQQAAQQAIVAGIAQNHTAHIFRDLYRLQVARSLLVIDLESCVRCGHCSWSCATLYGVSRLVRRGDKVVARLDESPNTQHQQNKESHVDNAPQSLLLPNSCQHCENPACMIECPTGAIGKDPSGEVFIRDVLCTGCASCAKACPWENIQMAPRPPDAQRPTRQDNPKSDTNTNTDTPQKTSVLLDYPELAVKCDLCRTYQGPACVQACPTESIFRINPTEEMADVRDLLGGAKREQTRAAVAKGSSTIVVGSIIATTGLGFAGIVMHSRGLWHPAYGIAWAGGIMAAFGFLLLLLYVIPKRGVRFWMHQKKQRANPNTKAPIRSILRPQLTWHLAIGLITLAFVLVHAPWPHSRRPTSGAALHLVFCATTALGIFMALAYRFIPPRLARIERTSALPEDFAENRRQLLDRLYREVSGRSDLVKKLFEKILLPYTRNKLGAITLLLSGRRLREEERHLRNRIDRLLEGRGVERLAGLTELIRLVVELRALPAQRFLLRLLRVPLPLHIITFGLALALLVLHALTATSVAR